MAADGQSDNTAPNVEVQMKQKRVSACRKSVVIALTDIHLHLLNTDGRPNSGCEHSEVVGGVFQQWQQRQLVTFAGADFYEHGMQAHTAHW